MTNKIGNFIMNVILVALIMTTVLVVVMHFNGLSWNPELGVYDTENFSLNVGEYMRTGMVHFKYTHLDLVDILEKIFVA